MSRHAARERALQTLFQLDMNRIDASVAASYTEAIVGEGDHDERYFRELLSGVLRVRERLDPVIAQYSQDWRIDRMPGVDRNILRIGAYELLFGLDIPPAVTLDEAVELSKEYGTDRSAKFVNGVLAGMLRDLDDLRANAGAAQV